ncbi:HalOD1 output domain-containing protein [Halorussus litoreus]|uniref:HalOD1 output domain-containing protein n=1 Tax=Halorussus litoreus TaxID=1710536 RepID=UPI000E2229E2|nr:HalOD1 output domain-containing protein [Halorussus litoreus]
MGDRNESRNERDVGQEDDRTSEQRDADDADGERGAGDDDRIYHRKVTPDAEEANQSLLRLLANVENCEVTDLPPLYEQIDHMVEHLFTQPPPDDAQAELTFSYHGYRIELDQTGNVSLMKLAERTPVESEE